MRQNEVNGLSSQWLLKVKIQKSVKKLRLAIKKLKGKTAKAEKAKDVVSSNDVSRVNFARV